MDRIVVRDHIKELIGNRKVLAALFHTFNFEPRFFENFVMPLFVPEKNFRDEIIYNKILWRHCAKEGLIPPVSVFCDYYAKDNTEAPALGYDIQCIKLPSAHGSITNFHPKQIFILLEDDRQNESLLFITGSGNLTANGWCDNHECFSFHEIKKTKTSPNKTTTNSLQDYISNVGKMAGLKNYLTSEELIHSFLNYVDLKTTFFNSISQSFPIFLEENIFEKNEIVEVEIVSPYFSNDLTLVKLLKSKGINNIKCLIPFLRNNEIQLEKERFIALQNAGLIWSSWNNKDINKEVRNQHSKIYRFYSKEKCFTIIGSVNFTNPAWSLITPRNNKANVETAILYKENNDIQKLLQKHSNLDLEQLTFLVKEDLENPVETILFERKAPDIEFIIDWKSKILFIIANIEQIHCHFYELLSGQQITNGKTEFVLDNSSLKELSKNSLIKILVNGTNSSVAYTYYANQINIETKPLGFKVDANTIMKYWQFLNDDVEAGKITRALAEKVTDESGVVDENNVENKLLLNDMAAHFSGIIKLEKFIFNESIRNQKEIKSHFSNLQYYLLSENIDTIPFYLNDIKSQCEEKKFQNSFYWMVLQILNQTIYAKAEAWQHRKLIDSTLWSQFKKDIRNKREEIKNEALVLTPLIPELWDKENWVIEQLLNDYE